MLTFTVCVAALTVMTAPAMAQTSKVKILKVDSTDFPKVRVYIQVPSASWAKAEATVEFTEKAPASVKRALEEKKKDPAEKNLPAAPEHQVAAKLKAFQDQRDPAEALLVIFMLDASSSMVGPPERETRKANHQAAIEMVKAIIRQQLRSVDRITLVKFTDKPDRFYGPHANRDAAIIALDKDYTQLKGGTRIYDSLDAVLDKYIAAVETPTLPHRRIAVVISDGRDTESNMAADRLATKFRADTKSGILVTFGVGASEKKRRKRYRDLANLASLAGRQANFSPEGTPAAAVSTFQGAIAPLEKQVEVNFEVPLYHWQKGKQDLVLSLRRDGKVTHVTVQVDLTNMTEEQLKKGADYRAQLKELTVVVVEEKEEKKWQIYAAIGGGIFLLLLIILIIASKSRKKAALERRRRIDALEAGMSTQIAAQEQRLVQQMEDQRIAAEEEARRAAEQLDRAVDVVGPDQFSDLHGERLGVQIEVDEDHKEPLHCEHEPRSPDAEDQVHRWASAVEELDEIRHRSPTF